MSKTFYLLSFTCAFIVGGLCGIEFGTSILRAEAVQAGVGRYVVANPNTGQTGFEWLPPKQ